MRLRMSITIIIRDRKIRSQLQARAQSYTLFIQPVLSLSAFNCSLIKDVLLRSPDFQIGDGVLAVVVEQSSPTLLVGERLAGK